MESTNIRNKSRTREKILSSATEAFAEAGYHATSMDDIVRLSGTSKGAIYFHFPGKEALFCSLIHRLADIVEFSAINAMANSKGAVNRVDAVLHSLFSLITEHRELAKAVIVGGAGLGPSLNKDLINLHERFAFFIKLQLDQAILEKSIDPIDTTIASYCWLGAINEMITRYLTTGQSHQLETSLPHIRNLLLKSVALSQHPYTDLDTLH